MKIKNVLENLVSYYELNRAVGHTETLISGLMHRPGNIILLTHIRDYGKHITQRLEREDIIVMTPGRFQSLPAYHAPLAIDNYALQLIFQAALTEMDALKEKIRIASVDHMEASAEIRELSLQIAGLNSETNRLNELANYWEAECQKLERMWHVRLYRWGQRWVTRLASLVVDPDG